MRIVWEGSRPPTRAELRALQGAARAGKLRNGDRARPGHVNPSSSRSVAHAREAFTEFHWGNRPKRNTRVRLPDFSALYKLGDLVAVEYLAKKGNERAIWVHKFSRPRPALTATPDGRLGPIVGGRAFVTERGIER